MKKILIINGPNLNMLGKRETEIYGKKTLNQIESDCKKQCDKTNLSLIFFQSNSECKIVEKIQSISTQFDGLIINAAAFTHTSISIHDSLKLLNIPIIEVHMSNVSKRENFRKESMISPIATGVMYGFGSNVYNIAIFALELYWKNDEN
tara:strand:- start:142 stop:588 length:447 start_codon:yes stop_codon:yes gene_type:complete